MPSKHPTVQVVCPLFPESGGKPKKIDIDALLAPLVGLLWDAQIMTYQCCQERYPGLAEIEFPGTMEVCEFLEVAQRPYRVEVETWDEGEGQECCIVARLLVLFPTADIPRLVEAFERQRATRRPTRRKRGSP